MGTNDQWYELPLMLDQFKGARPHISGKLQQLQNSSKLLLNWLYVSSREETRNKLNRSSLDSTLVIQSSPNMRFKMYSELIAHMLLAVEKHQLLLLENAKA